MTLRTVLRVTPVVSRTPCDHRRSRDERTVIELNDQQLEAVTGGDKTPPPKHVLSATSTAMSMGGSANAMSLNSNAVSQGNEHRRHFDTTDHHDDLKPTMATRSDVHRAPPPCTHTSHIARSEMISRAGLFNFGRINRRPDYLPSFSIFFFSASFISLTFGSWLVAPVI
jgi:hypothetical protein